MGKIQSRAEERIFFMPIRRGFNMSLSQFVKSICGGTVIY